MRRTLLVGIGVALLAVAGGANTPKDAEKFWPQWRGPNATGAALLGNPPAEWNETKNIKWKVAIPGAGSATPVVWGDTMYLLSAVPTEKRAANAPAPAADAAVHGARGGRAVAGRRAGPSRNSSSSSPCLP